MQKKRIAVIAEYFPPRLGADRRGFEILKRLSGIYDIHFITLPPAYVLFIKKIESSFHEQEKIISCEKMMGYSIGLPRLLQMLWTKNFVFSYLLTMVYLIFKVMRRIIQLKPNLIIINDTSVYTGLLGFICSTILNKKLLVEYNDLHSIYDAMHLRRKVKLNRFLRFMLILIEDAIVKRGWKVVAISSFLKNYAMNRNLREDIVVIPDGVDTDMFDPSKFKAGELRSRYATRNEVKLCLYAGRIDECAGSEIIYITAKLLADEKHIKFIIAGEGDPLVVNKLSKLDNVVMTGLVPKEEVPKYLAAADVVLVPFPDNIVSHGISPLKLFEAMAMEKPVIASAVSGIKEAVRNDFNGVLVSSDPKEWAASIIELTENQDKVSFLGKNGRKTVIQNYDWDQLAKAFHRVIADE